MTSDGELVNILRLPGSGERRRPACRFAAASLNNTLKGVGSSEEAD